MREGESVEPPKIKINPTYNPFDAQPKTTSANKTFGENKTNNANWEQLYKGFEKPESENDLFKSNSDSTPQQQSFSIEPSNENNRFLQIKGKYILTAVKSGIMLIDQKRAHQRIIFDEYNYKMGSQSGIGQKLLYPQKIELDAVETELFNSLIPDVNRLGFEVELFGKNTFVVNSVPAEFPDKNISDWITQIIDSIKNNERDFAEAIRENIVKSLAKFLSIPYGKILTQEEMAHINDKLFVSRMPNLTPNGKPIITIIGLDELEKKLK